MSQNGIQMPLLVIIGYVWPEPNSSAAGSRMLNLIQLFQQHGWQVIFASAADKSSHRFNLPAIGVAEHTIALNCDSFEQWLSSVAPQAVMFDRFMLEEQFGWRVAAACPEALRILDMEDVHALRYARHEAYKAGGIAAVSALTPMALNNDYAYREIAAIYRCDITLVISEYEMQLLQQHYQVPLALLCYCPFWLKTGTDLAYRGASFAERTHFISIGNFRHAPNWQAVLWLKQQIWPLIRKQLPQAELHIYGAYPPPKATALHNAKEGFLVKGWAEDAITVMQQARVCLAPLPFGAGLKGKLLEAMQCGTPSVTTAIGAEGMTVNQQWAGIIADEAEDIAMAAVALYQQEANWLHAQQQGSVILQQRFSDIEADKVWQQLQLLLTEPDDIRNARRARNFTGQMLQSHAYRSTRYMGQWIEAKNRKAE